MSKQAMALYAHTAVETADTFPTNGAPVEQEAAVVKVIANVGAALAHAITELADATRGVQPQTRKRSRSKKEPAES